MRTACGGAWALGGGDRFGNQSPKCFPNNTTAESSSPPSNGTNNGDLNQSVSEYAIRFYGNGTNDIDRIKIPIDDPSNNFPGPPVDIGNEDFTIEFWLKGSLADNSTSEQICGNNINWIYGNIIFDRDRFSQDRKFGFSLAGGKSIFGITGQNTGDITICGNTNILDEKWHHIAIQRQRSNGLLWLFIDGKLIINIDGPDGDVSYPDNGVPKNHCGGSCDFSDPFIILGAEKHDAGGAYPSFNGLIDELRISNTLRYSKDFPLESGIFDSDDHTVGLYHFNLSDGVIAFDSSSHPDGPSHGQLSQGGDPIGPNRVLDSPFSH